MKLIKKISIICITYLFLVDPIYSQENSTLVLSNLWKGIFLFHQNDRTGLDQLMDLNGFKRWGNEGPHWTYVDKSDKNSNSYTFENNAKMYTGPAIHVYDKNSYTASAVVALLDYKEAMEFLDSLELKGFKIDKRTEIFEKKGKIDRIRFQYHPNPKHYFGYIISLTEFKPLNDMMSPKYFISITMSKSVVEDFITSGNIKF